MSNKCGACGKFLKATGVAQCNGCPRAYHRLCVGISDAVGIDKAWVCPECKRVKPKGDNSNTPVKSATCPSPLPCETHPVISSKLPSPAPCAPSGEDSWAEMKLMRRDLAEYVREIREFREEFRSFQFGFEQRLDGFEQRLAAVEKRERSPAQEEVAELKTTVAILKAEVNDREQELLLSDLDIGHLPECANENVAHTVTVLAAKLGVTLQEQDIVFAERVGRADQRGGPDEAAAGRPRRVVVRLARRSLRDRVLQAARVRRTLTSADLGLAGPSRRLYVNERLTKTNRQLFHTVRDECRKREWRYAWTKQGRVYARQGDGKQAFLIRPGAALGKVFEANNV